MGQTFFKFLYLNTFHSRLLQLPSLVMWHHHYGWHLTPTPFWQAHGCCPSCSGVTCGQEESQAAWASMGAMPCCWPSCKQLCMIWQTLALESSPIDSCLLLTMPRQGRGVRIWPSGQSPPSWPGRYLPPRWTLSCDLSCFQKATLCQKEGCRGTGEQSLSGRNQHHYDEALLQFHWPLQAVITSDGRWKPWPTEHSVLQGWGQWPYRNTQTASRAGCLRVKSPPVNAEVVTAPRIRGQVFW